jgi:hypothetical protein
MMVMRAMDDRASAREIRLPTTPREKMSRPSVSVPRRCRGDPSAAPKRWRFMRMPSHLYSHPGAKSTIWRGFS